VRSDLVGLAVSWREVLVGDATNARPIVAALLNGRVTIVPVAKKERVISGTGTLAGLFERSIFPSDWRRHRA
jgi:hypothetical protein